eukprot:CAMPEP_0177596546 /NCGR_PEP_ID=MMETSP0419_2-20121207/11152_1 /TAXON_ID=582737 /ORGANISM="Tetraselmis sp., Strain GSL018" /LENGTH=381 /DNA_ID=CAMNT_0019088489 /DNA_START=305 /DNA_END=1451 /DNA_ORIENTATION=-
MDGEGGGKGRAPREPRSVLRPLDALQVDALLHHLPQRAHLPQLVHVGDRRLDGSVDLLLGAEPPKAVADGRVRHLLVHSEGAENVARLQARRGAGGSAGDGDLLEAHEERLALHKRERQVAVANVAVCGVRGAIEDDTLEAGHDAAAEPLLEPGHVLAVDVHLLLRDLAGGAEPDREGRGHRPRAQPTLLPAAAHLRLHADARAAAEVERPDALRAVDLVAADGHGVDLHRVDVERDLTNSLSGVGVEEDLLGAAEVADLLERLYDADLVVDGHDGDKGRVGPDGLLELLDVDATVRLDGQVGDLPAALLEVAARVEDALVVSLCGDYVVLLLPIEARNPLHGEVVGLRCSAGEDDSLGSAPMMEATSALAFSTASSLSHP